MHTVEENSFFQLYLQRMFPVSARGFSSWRDLKGRSFQVVSIWGPTRVSVGGEGEKEQKERRRERKKKKNQTKKLNQNRFWESTLKWGWSQSCNKLDVKAQSYWRQWGFCHWLGRRLDSIPSLHRAVGTPTAPAVSRITDVHKVKHVCKRWQD